MSKKPRILVTGATGFIGSHLIPHLFEYEYDAYLLERYVTGRYATGEGKKIKTVFCDLRDSSEVKKIVHKVRPDIVVHLASISPVAYSYEHPHEVLSTNFLGTVNLAEACLNEAHELKQFIFASTSETYGNGPNPKTEKTKQNPNSPYAVSKVACEKYLLYMHDAYNFPITIMRNFNTYGRKNNCHFIIERAIVQMLTKKTVKLGDPTPIRDFVYIDDLINAFLLCINNLEIKGEIFNFCTGIGTSVQKSIDTLSKLLNFKGKIMWNTIPQRPLDIKELIGDYSKAKRILGWEPKFMLEDGLKLTIEYWQKKDSKAHS